MRGCAEAKFLFLFKEKGSFGGRKHFQLQIINRRRMTEKVNIIESGKLKMSDLRSLPELVLLQVP